MPLILSHTSNIFQWIIDNWTNYCNVYIWRQNSSSHKTFYTCTKCLPTTNPSKRRIYPCKLLQKLQNLTNLDIEKTCFANSSKRRIYLSKAISNWQRIIMNTNYGYRNINCKISPSPKTNWQSNQTQLSVSKVILTINICLRYVFFFIFHIRITHDANLTYIDISEILLSNCSKALLLPAIKNSGKLEYHSNMWYTLYFALLTNSRDNRAINTAARFVKAIFRQEENWMLWELITWQIYCLRRNTAELKALNAVDNGWNSSLNSIIGHLNVTGRENARPVYISDFVEVFFV